jgi:hypothetical protein
MAQAITNSSRAATPVVRANYDDADRRHREPLCSGDSKSPEHPEPAKHAASAVERHSRRGWRIDTPAHGVCIDGIVALPMAIERARARQPALELLGWP